MSRNKPSPRSLDWSRAKLARFAALHTNAVANLETLLVPTDRREPRSCAPITDVGISTTHMISKTVVREHRG